MSDAHVIEDPTNPPVTFFIANLTSDSPFALFVPVGGHPVLEFMDVVLLSVSHTPTPITLQVVDASDVHYDIAAFVVTSDPDHDLAYANWRGRVLLHHDWAIEVNVGLVPGDTATATTSGYFELKTPIFPPL